MELELIKCAVEKLDCSACIFQYDCEDKDNYRPCDDVKHKIDNYTKMS